MGQTPVVVDRTVGDVDQQAELNRLAEEEVEEAVT